MNRDILSFVDVKLINILNIQREGRPPKIIALFALCNTIETKMIGLKFRMTREVKWND